MTDPPSTPGMTVVIATVSAVISGALMFYAGRGSTQSEWLNQQGFLMASQTVNHGSFNAGIALELLKDDADARDPVILKLLRVQLEDYRIESESLQGAPFGVDWSRYSSVDGDVSEALANLPSMEDLNAAIEAMPVPESPPDERRRIVLPKSL